MGEEVDIQAAMEMMQQHDELMRDSPLPEHHAAIAEGLENTAGVLRDNELDPESLVLDEGATLIRAQWLSICYWKAKFAALEEASWLDE